MARTFPQIYVFLSSKFSVFVYIQTSWIIYEFLKRFQFQIPIRSITHLLECKHLIAARRQSSLLNNSYDLFYLRFSGSLISAHITVQHGVPFSQLRNIRPAGFEISVKPSQTFVGGRKGLPVERRSHYCHQLGLKWLTIDSHTGMHMTCIGP